jgi:hypothetical protein
LTSDHGLTGRAVASCRRPVDRGTTDTRIAAAIARGEEGFGLHVELIQRTPNDFIVGRCDLSVARTRILSIRQAIRLNMPDGVR